MCLCNAFGWEIRRGCELAPVIGRRAVCWPQRDPATAAACVVGSHRFPAGGSGSLQSILFRRVISALKDRRDSQRVRAGGSAEGDRASQAQDVRPVVAVSARHGAFNPSSRPSVHPLGVFCTRRTTSPRLAVCDGGPSSGVLTSDDGDSSRCPPPVVLPSRKRGAPVGAPLHEAQKAGCGSRSPYSRLPDTYRHNACTG